MGSERELAKDGELHILQKTFLEHGAIQCGYCIPGFILTAKRLLGEDSAATEEEIREYIRGNLCRCTGYVNIVRAIKATIEELEKSGK